jgi:hypothetical protein
LVLFPHFDFAPLHAVERTPVHTMQAGLGLGTSLGRSLWDVSWVLNAYAVTLAALLLPAGVHGPDRAVQARFGRLRLRPGPGGAGGPAR